MAESLGEKDLSCKLNGVKTDNSSNVECAVCLQISVHPAELPCGHIFCYLCIKGIVNQGRRCAMCRQSIPIDYLDKPRLLKPVDSENTSKAFEDGHLWFYEGHNGWWQYDERTSLELESAYQKGERCCELLVAGYLYVADFDAMLQYRQNDPSRRRRIKRDLATISSKGVAGLKTTKSNSDSNCFDNPEFVSNVLVPDLQSLHISGQPLQRNSVTATSRINSFAYDQQNSVTQENGLRCRNRRLSLGSSLLNPGLSQTVGSENGLSPTTETFVLDNTIHNTLDWTIEQIEALNSELSNDYENLFRDVNNYEHFNNILENSRSTFSSNDNPRRLENFNQRLSRSLENDQQMRNGHSLRLNRSGEILQSDQNSLIRDNERTLIRPSILSNIDSDIQLLSRLRGASRSRQRRGISKQPPSLRDHETLF